MILVFGQNGQLASAFKEHQSKTLPMHFIGSSELDLLKVGAAAEKITETKPKLVINCAAYTAVDKAETESSANERLNADLLKEIGEVCAKLKIPVLHFSTDYVYPGTGDQPQSEDMPKDPQNAYGRAKLRGEEMLRASGCVHHIYRISWVFSAFGANFVKTMLRLGQEREELKVVADQVGSPMSAHAIANLMMETAVPHLLRENCTDRKTYNLSAQPYVSWQEFAIEIFEIARGLGYPLKIQKVYGIPSAEYPTPARRPLNSRMDDSQFRRDFGKSLPVWRESLSECLNKLKKG